ncbi:MAG: hypothetical protein GY719_23850 [bacterium]|nr:hypothetical protein [bacterium]
MSSLNSVFRILNEMKAERVIVDYALGGAMAVLFYAEPARTYDLDVFVHLPPADGALVRLTPIYDWLQRRSFFPKAEHVMIHGVPVQFLPAYNQLVEEAIEKARVLDYEGVAVRVASPEHLVALAIEAGGSKRRERALQLLESDAVDRQGLAALLGDHGLPVEILNND